MYGVCMYFDPFVAAMCMHDDNIIMIRTLGGRALTIEFVIHDCPFRCNGKNSGARRYIGTNYKLYTRVPRHKNVSTILVSYNLQFCF